MNIVFYKYLLNPLFLTASILKSTLLHNIKYPDKLPGKPDHNGIHQFLKNIRWYQSHFLLTILLFFFINRPEYLK